MLLWIESRDLYSFVLDLVADGYGVSEPAMNAVTNAQTWHRRLSPLHAQSVDILRKRDGTDITFKRAVSDCNIWAVRKAQQLAHLKTANHKVNGPFQLCYRDLVEPFPSVAIGGYKYVSKVTDKYTKWAAIYVSPNNNQALPAL